MNDNAGVAIVCAMIAGVAAYLALRYWLDARRLLNRLDDARAEIRRLKAVGSTDTPDVHAELAGLVADLQQARADLEQTAQAAGWAPTRTE